MRLRIASIASSSLPLLLALALAGCPRSNPTLHDSGPPVDAPSFEDTDRDGLCDAQEAALGTRIDATDTDADGFSDLAEASLGFDPLLPASPDRADIVVLEERPGATARVSVVVSVSGMGETYTGAFSATRPYFDDGQSATMYYDGASAIGAEPMANVFAIEGEQVLGVMGRTQLVYEVRFTFDDPVLGCARAHPFQYVVKREDGRIVGVGRFTLVIQPPIGAPGAGTWCGATPCW